MGWLELPIVFGDKCHENECWRLNSWDATIDLNLGSISGGQILILAIDSPLTDIDCESVLYSLKIINRKINKPTAKRKFNQSCRKNS